ncbi:hypothetical protein DPMN_031329 [Dreissena polymorpha]|uniref:Uncharacterized protein n=1 Tax=Dreissena polymorpha TaxID=45954 RepID=A0A9D4M204_DREPO|nr:hypothetical protein DPMN_031329 [Dreissena polymorpha]
MEFPRYAFPPKRQEVHSDISIPRSLQALIPRVCAHVQPPSHAQLHAGYLKHSRTRSKREPPW